jgi:hypothetical protein
MTRRARPASIDDRREATASALRADPLAFTAAASRRAAGATTPSVVTATPSPGSHHALRDSGGDFGTHRGAPTPASLSTKSAGGGGAADNGPSLSMAAVLSAALAAVLSLSQLLRAGEIRWRSTMPTLRMGTTVTRRVRAPKQTERSTQGRKSGTGSYAGPCFAGSAALAGAVFWGADTSSADDGPRSRGQELDHREIQSCR